jgi:predicted nuclease of predicted toxin-antitoxin system
VRVLLDENVPVGLKPYLSGLGYDCETVREEGWASKKNGELLALAEHRWDVLLTTDRKMKYEQNLVGRNIAVLILAAKSNRLSDLLPLMDGCCRSLETIQHGQILEIAS